MVLLTQAFLVILRIVHDLVYYVYWQWRVQFVLDLHHSIGRLPSCNHWQLQPVMPWRPGPLRWFFRFPLGLEVGEDRYLVRFAGRLDWSWWHSEWWLGHFFFWGEVFEIFQDAISPRNVYLGRGEPIFVAAVFRAKFCAWLTGYLNDVSQPMLDEISPDWAWPMKLRRREAW